VVKEYVYAAYIDRDGAWVIYESTDDFESGLAVLKQNNWYKYAVKVAVAIDDDANVDTLAKFTGTHEAVLKVHTPEALKKMIRFVSVTSSNIGSGSGSSNSTTKQDDMVGAIKDMKDDPDYDAIKNDPDMW